MRRTADIAYAVLAAAFAAALLVQVYLAGAGAFGHGHGAFGAHETFGNVLGVVAVVLLLLALAAGAGRSTVVGALVVAVLTEAAQHGLADAGHDNRWVGGLHALDGMLILGLSVWLADAAARRVRGRRS